MKSHPAKKLESPSEVDDEPVKKPKNYVLDTNVLIHDPLSMFQFEDNVVWIPVEVLEELDRFKSEASTRGANAREVHRSLNEKFASTDEVKSGVELANGGRLHVCVNPNIEFTESGWRIVQETARYRMLRNMFPDFATNDNRILATASYLADTHPGPTIIVTKDINMQLKARTLGLEAQDYRTDRVEDGDIPRTQRVATEEEYESITIPGHQLQAFASQDFIKLSIAVHLPPNQYVLLRSAENPTHGVPARHLRNGEFRKLRREHITIRGGRSLNALNLGQHFFLDALYDPEISLITVYGKAGTGKTLLSVGAALEQVQSGDYEKLLVTRVIMPTGRDIGFLPGRVEEKMQPWVQPTYDALELLLSKPRKPEKFEKKKQSSRKQHMAAEAPSQGLGQSGKPSRPWERLMQLGLLEVEAIAHIRGRSIPRAIFIVDEAQQLTPHEAKTLVTRMGRGSKMVMIGDLSQIDNPYVDAHTNGLVYTRSRLQGQQFLAHVNLFKGERSEMAEVAADLM